MGQWQGRLASTPASGSTAADNPVAKRPVESTTSERLDFSLLLDFQDHNRVRLVLIRGDGRQTKEGTWQVLGGSRDELWIEICVAPQAPAEVAGDDPPEAETRRFRLRFDLPEKDAFLLDEVGADGALGPLVFRRQTDAGRQTAAGEQPAPTTRRSETNSHP